MPPAGHQARVRATIQPVEGTPLACQCALPLSRQTLTFVAGLLRAHLKKTGSRWRKLPPGKIALIVPAVLRHDRRLAGMAGGNSVSASTTGRWTWEVIGLLAARAPRLDRALATISRQGGEAVLLDGTLIPTRRRPGTANRKNYNGKHKKHGLLFLALTDERGNLTWISSARRGAASEITTARHDHLADRLRTAGLGALADPGFTGLDPDPGDPVIITGWKSTRTSKTTPAQPQADQALPAARAPAGHGFSDLKNWRILTRLRLDPARAHHRAARPARPHPPVHHPLTDDHGLRPAAPASPSTANPGHASPLTSQFRLERSHSSSPGSVIREITRCLLSGSTAIFAVKSADSYAELDQLVADSGLDPAAASRPSLYQAAHSGNITELAATSLNVRHVTHDHRRADGRRSGTAVTGRPAPGEYAVYRAAEFTGTYYTKTYRWWAADYEVPRLFARHLDGCGHQASRPRSASRPRYSSPIRSGSPPRSAGSSTTTRSGSG
jgi:DDE superfamily endonuclease